MSRNKLLIGLMVVYLASLGVRAAAPARPSAPPPPLMNLRVDPNPQAISNPQVVFTATLVRLPRTPGTTPVVEFYLVGQQNCPRGGIREGGTCQLGSAPVKNGQAFLFLSIEPGNYTAASRITAAGQTTESNQYVFVVR